MIYTEKHRELVERIGVFYEHKGIQPLVGRIIGLMMVNEECELTFDEIVGELGVSKSAVSNALNFLQAKETISYHTKPGDRKRYFKLLVGNLEDQFEKDLMSITRVQEFITETLELREDKDSPFCQKLSAFSEFLIFFRAEMPKLFEKFKTKGA